MTLAFSGRVASGTSAGRSLVATAKVTASGADAVAANNRDSETIPVVAQPVPTTTTTTTVPATTTTVRPSSRGGGRSLPITGPVVLGVLVAGAALFTSGVARWGVTRGPRTRHDRQHGGR